MFGCMRIPMDWLPDDFAEQLKKPPAPLTQEQVEAKTRVETALREYCDLGAAMTSKGEDD